MFKKLKEFFFGPFAEEAVVAPYKVETPAPLVLPVVETPAPPVVPVAVVAPVKVRKPRTPKPVVVVAPVSTKKVSKEKAAKPAAIVASKKFKKS